MHVVGARFSDRDAAVAALHDLRVHVSVTRADVGVRPLGSTRYDRPTFDHLLAGRFETRDVETVVGILERHGGVIVWRREEWLRPAASAATSTPKPPNGRPARTRPGERVASSLAVPDALRRSAPSLHRPCRRPAAPLHGRAAGDRRVRK
jgi:hypothetical protein